MKRVNKSVVIGDGTEIVATVSGTVNLLINKSGKQFALSNIMYAPEFTKKIISVACLRPNGNRVHLLSKYSVDMILLTSFLNCFLGNRN